MKSTGLAALLSALLTLIFAASADASIIHRIDVHAALNDDGSMRITQRWHVVASGTESEFYTPQGSLGDMEIRDFTVRDDRSGVFRRDNSDWDVSLSAAEKKGRCGIAKTDKGFELCWGRGDDGPHIYEVAWTFTNAVKAYDDYDGFNIRFVNDRITPIPRDVTVTIEKPGYAFKAGDVDMWAFGFDGTILPLGGKIVVSPESADAWNANSYINVMLRFKKGLFSPASRVKGSFSAVEDRALKSDNKDKFFFETLPNVLYFLFIFVQIALVFIILRKFLKVYKGALFNKQLALFGEPKSKEMKKLKEELLSAPWSREIPFDGDLMLTYFAVMNTYLAASIKKTAPVEAYFLRLINKGCLTVSQEPDSADGVTLAVRDTFAAAEFLAPHERELYEMLKAASGSNNILEEGEFRKWGASNGSAMDNWLESYKKRGTELFLSGGLAINTLSASAGGSGRTLALTDRGRDALLKTVGFRKFLLDFTLIAEKGAAETELWDNYLVFAALFDCTKKVSDEFLKLNPFYGMQSAILKSGSAGLPYVQKTAGSFYRATSTSYRSSSYSSSSGGRSSGGGGGGHSGGGSGGGSR